MRIRDHVVLSDEDLKCNVFNHLNPILADPCDKDLILKILKAIQKHPLIRLDQIISETIKENKNPQNN